MKSKTGKKTELNKPHKLNLNEKLLIIAVAIVAGAAFVLAAISTLSNWFKAPLLILILFASGKLISHIGRLENYYGVIILRGEKGFGTMRFFAKYPRIMRALADFGLSLGFGLVYGLVIFRKSPKTFFAHLILVSLFFLSLQNPTPADSLTNEIVKAAGILGGLFLFGVSALVIHGLNILTVPETAAGAALVVPGVTIPFWEGLIAIIIAATVHEVAHGVLAMVEKLEVKNSGAILFGVLPIGAFVEPNEKKLTEMEMPKKRRILIAGTTSNFIFSLLFGLLMIPLGSAIIANADGVQVADFTKDSVSAGILEKGEVIYAVNGVAVKNYGEFADFMKDKREGEKILLATDKGEKSITLGKNGKMGILPQNNLPQSDALLGVMLFLFATFSWVSLINSALAIINLVPLFLTDGYRLVYEEARSAFPSRGDALAKRVAIIAGALSVLLLLVNFIPNFR